MIWRRCTPFLRFVHRKRNQKHARPFSSMMEEFLVKYFNANTLLLNRSFYPTTSVHPESVVRRSKPKQSPWLVHSRKGTTKRLSRPTKRSSTHRRSSFDVAIVVDVAVVGVVVVAVAFLTHFRSIKMPGLGTGPSHSGVEGPSGNTYKQLKSSTGWFTLNKPKYDTSPRRISTQFQRFRP